MKAFATSAMLAATLVAGTVTPALATEPDNRVYVLTGNARDLNAPQTKPRKHKEPAPEVKEPNLTAPKAKALRPRPPKPRFPHGMERYVRVTPLMSSFRRPRCGSRPHRRVNKTRQHCRIQRNWMSGTAK